MSEIFFVMKTFLIAAALTMMLQVRLGGITIEERATAWLQTSATAEWVQGAASGGAVAIKNFSRRLKDAVSDVASGENDSARAERAGRY